VLVYGVGWREGEGGGGGKYVVNKIGLGRSSRTRDKEHLTNRR